MKCGSLNTFIITITTFIVHCNLYICSQSLTEVDITFVLLQIDVDFDVEGGEHFGFFSLRHGVVAFSSSDRDEDDDSYNQNYCGGLNKPEVGGIVDLALSSDDFEYTYRDYAIWFHLCRKH